MSGRVRVAVLVAVGLAATAAVALAVGDRPPASSRTRPGSIDAAQARPDVPAARITDAERTDGASPARSQKHGPGLLLAAASAVAIAAACLWRRAGRDTGLAPKPVAWFTRHSGRAPPSHRLSLV